MSVVAGLVVEVAPGAAGRVAERLAREPGVSLAGEAGGRLALVCEAADGRALEALAERLLAADAGVLGVFPTFVGDAGGEG